VNDGFIDLQTSPSVFIDADSKDGRMIRILGLSELSEERLWEFKDQLYGELSRRAGLK